MTNDEYRTFWERLLGRYPNFAQTMEQTKDWQRELQTKDFHLVEAAVATVVSKYSSEIPKLPWILDNYRKIKEQRARDKVSNQVPIAQEQDLEYEKIKQEKAKNIEQLKRTPLETLKEEVVKAVNRYPHHLSMPTSKEVEDWSPWLRAVVYCSIYGR